MENKNLTSPSANQLNQKIQEHFGIKRSQAYSRTKKLGIKPHKENGEVWLDNEQFQSLEKLHQHLENGGTMEDYQTSEIVVAKSQEIQQQQPQTISTTNQDQTINIAQEQEQIGQEEKLAKLIKSAQQRAAGIIIAEEMLTAQFKENTDLLDEDLQEQVRAAREMNAPKSVDPTAYANSLVEKCLGMLN